MTKSDIIKEVAEGTGLTKVEIEAVLDEIGRASCRVRV